MAQTGRRSLILAAAVSFSSYFGRALSLIKDLLKLASVSVFHQLALDKCNQHTHSGPPPLAECAVH